MTKILVDSELLDRAIEALQYESLQGFRDGVAGELRAALSAPQQEAAALVRYSVGALPHFVPVINGSATFDCSAIEALEYEPLYTHPAPRVPEGWQERKPLAGAMTLAHRMCTKYLHDGRLRYSFTEQHMQDFIARLLGAKAQTTDDRKDAEIAKLVRMKLTSGNGIPVERCTIRASEIAAIDAAMAAQKGEKE